MNYKEKFLKSINKIAEKEIDKVNINQHYLEVLESQDKEIERLKEDIGNYVNIVLHERKEIDRLHSIIEEVREYIEEKTCELNSCFSDGDWHCTTIKKLLEILDKENKDGQR